MIAFGLQSIAFGVGAPKRFVLRLSRFHVLLPRHLTREVELILSRIGACMLAVAYPSFVKARHHWPLRFEDHSNTDGFTGVGQPFSELRKGASHDRRD